jgi:hypothetical protein
MRDTRGFESLIHLHELVVRHATDEQRKRVLRLTAGGVPSRAYRPMENSLYLSESAAVLFERLFKEVAELREMVKALIDIEEKEVR